MNIGAKITKNNRKKGYSLMKFSSRKISILITAFILSLMVIPAGANDFSALGRGSSAGRIIHSVSDTAYLTKAGSAITEEMISGLSSADYGRTGLVADGNSRLILRYRSSQQGSVTFSVSPAIPGSRLETFTGRQQVTSALNTVSTSNGYQVSAVLVAPEAWPSGIAYPKGDFTVTASFTPSNGEAASSETLTLTLQAAPVVLIHGAFSNNEKMFGYATGSKTGVWHKLENAGLKVAGWNYDNTKSPKSVITSNSNGLASTIDSTLNALNAQGFEATRVDLVTHSSGGIMARQYLRNDIDTGNKTANSYGLGTVRRVVTLASPNKGTPIGSFLTGKFDTLPSSWQNWAGKTWWESKGYPLLRTLAMRGADEAMEDVALGSSYLAGLGYPGVPFHSIYGKVKSDDAKISQLFDDVVNQNIVSLSQIDWLPQQLVNILTSEKLALISGVVRTMSDDMRFKEILGALHGDNDHDLVVSEPSAKDIFPSNAVTAFYGLGNHSHVTIGQQDDVGDRVLELLRGGTENFMINTASTSEYDAAFDAAADSFGAYLRASAEDDLSEYLDESMTLDTSEIVPQYMGDDEDEAVIQSITLSGKSGAVFSDDIGVVIEDDEGSAKFFNIAANNMQSFDVELWADSYNRGVYKVSYFTVQDGKLKISPTQTVAYPPLFSSSESPVLYHAGTIYAHVGDELPIGLMVQGKYGNYDISAPSLGLAEYTVSDPSIAEITNSGKVKALKEGTATITATALSQTVSIKFIVKPVTFEADTVKDLGDSTSDGYSGGIKVGDGTSGGCSAGFSLAAFALASLMVFVRKSER